ncbi:MAG: UvrD-helicase domain-containing protein [Planctomycetes bacterium]|nr:UvrD-helicase domain-containing protein [Planctomycetota bacterium]
MTSSRTTVTSIDLHRHGVVEASAGTGKTFTIEQLVLRLLTEEDVALDQILVVTYTEKATGELRTRLRGILETTSRNRDDLAARLRPAIDQFDQAPIYTIHAFCQRLLQDHALEHGQDFHVELADDFELLGILLRDVQRKLWRTHFGDRLKAVLDNAGYDRKTARDWDRCVLDIAGKYKPRCGHQLRPAFVPDWWQRLDEADANWTGQLQIFTIAALHRQLRDFKRQRGLQSFDDMIASVEENLDPQKNADAERLRHTLRERYRYGIVDEFQDTDPLQWNIFRRIFLEGGSSKLFVVGDPKQAIYGFRGADLPTYLQATEAMRTQFGAADYPLDVNWRSEPELLEALNCVFADGEWFPRDEGIRYVHVHAPDGDEGQGRIHSDYSGRAPLTLVDVTQWDRLKLMHRHFSRFVAQEIQRLLAGGSESPVITFSRKNEPPRPLRADDICILVAKRRDAEPIVLALEELGIAYSFYKRAGLWQSDEAVHLEMLLRTLAEPDDRSAFRKALLTCFFRVQPADLARNPDVPAGHPARELYQAWIELAETRQWSSLCRSLLEDTGLCFDGRGDSPRQAHVSLSTLRHLLAALEQAGHGLNFDLLGLLDWLRQHREQREGDDANVQPVEMDRPKVKIMTIHVSKGLEFPIVFLAGGFTQAQASKDPAIFRDDAGRGVFDLLGDSDAQARIARDQLSGQRRLYYVAMTRAALKLYVPKIKKPKKGSQFLGPLGTIVLPALERACPDKLGDSVAQVVTPPLATSTPKPAAETPTKRIDRPSLRVSGPLFPIVDPNLSKRRIVMRSFSSMTKHHLSAVGEGSSFGDRPLPVDDEADAPLDRDDTLRGPVFGDIVHNVLENIDFAEVGRSKGPDDLLRAGEHARKRIDEEIKKGLPMLRSRVPIDQLADACRQQVAALVWHALRTPLGAIGGPLCDIPSEDRLAEVEFLYPEIVDAPADERFITGFMDLLFRKNGQYYLLDWKTNLLPDYSIEQIQHSMAESDYHRQYRLYLQAIRRWLQRVPGPGDAFRASFGGVFYLYIRGMNGRDDSAGVFFHRPTQHDLDLAAALT